jgi:hypothetical protein
MSNHLPGSGSSDTIASIAQPSDLRPLIHNPGELDEGQKLQETRFKIRLANTEGRRSNAAYLIQHRYAWRGYRVSPLVVDAANLITLVAFDKDQAIATLTVGTDSESGLAVEYLYPDEVRAVRSAGVRLCEFTKLAVHNIIRSKSVLAAIFHIAYIHARRLRGATDLLIEVNPRHVKFYQSMLGFDVLGPERMDPRVSAPAVLLRLDLSYAELEITRWGGHRERAGETRLLYPLFFSPAEEEGIERRLLTLK